MFCLNFSRSACRLEHFLSNEELLEQMGLDGLNLVNVIQLTHLYLCGEAVQSLNLCLPAQRGQVSSLQSRALWLYLEHLKRLFTDT